MQGLKGGQGGKERNGRKTEGKGKERSRKWRKMEEKEGKRRKRPPRTIREQNIRKRKENG